MCVIAKPLRLLIDDDDDEDDDDDDDDDYYHYRVLLRIQKTYQIFGHMNNSHWR